MGKLIRIVEADRLTEENHGECVASEYLIRISKQYPLESRWSTLRHELGHMILALSGLSELLTEEMEEAIVLCYEHNFPWP